MSAAPAKVGAPILSSQMPEQYRRSLREPFTGRAVRAPCEMRAGLPIAGASLTLCDVLP